MRLALSAVLIATLIALTACADQVSSPVDPQVATTAPPAPASSVSQPEVTAALPTVQAVPTRPPDASGTTEAQHAGTTIASQLEPTATSTSTPTTPATARPTNTPAPTSSVVPGWLAYWNDFLSYEFAYPPEAKMRIQGVTGFPTAELPAGMTSEAYLQQLEETYPDDLCVEIRYRAAFVVFVPAAEKEGRYTGPCGVTGVGDYEITNLTETILIDGVPHSASGFVLRGSDGSWQGEFYMLDANESIGIHYGAFGGTEAEFLEAEATLLQIVSSFRESR